MSQTVLGVFSDSKDAERAIQELETRYYNPKDISLVMKSKEEAQDVAKKTGADVSTGAVSGAATGAALGALAGMLVAAGIVPGLGTLFVGGSLVAALGLSGTAATAASGAATGALAGGIIGVLGKLGVSAADASTYESEIKEGGILVAVPANEGEEMDVHEILEQHGADQIRTVEAAT